MSRILKEFRKSICCGEKGFTLIELLIVVAVLGALASVVVPNVGSFLGTANRAASNTEASNVKTAAMAHLANWGGFPTTSANLTTTTSANDYLSGDPDGTYTFNATTGLIASATAGTGITSTFTFNAATQQWE
ncbi:type II secretion system protein [Chloroflexota bacterium]